MTDAIASIIAGVLAREGSAYTDRPDDAGGPTKGGITLKTLSEYLGRPATVAELQALTREQEVAIYYHLYVELPGFGAVLGVSQALGEKLVDVGVNCGQPTAIEYLQRCLNVFSDQGRQYARIAQYPHCGTETITALKAYLAGRGTEGELVLLEAIACLQGAHYIAIAEARPADQDFVYGWIRARINLGDSNAR